MTKIAIILPVLDDWESLNVLLNQVDQALSCVNITLDIIVIDDGSNKKFTEQAISKYIKIDLIDLIELNANYGHQNALAVGMCHAYTQNKYTSVVLMDSDGEDKASDLIELIELSFQHKNSIIVCKRSQRSEGFRFKIGYYIYKLLFKIFVGKVINYGNFSLIPASKLPHIISNSDGWNNVPATILKSKVSKISLSTARGERISGKSKMNLTSLVLHGLSAISVFTDQVFIRVISVLGLIVSLILILMVAVVYIKYQTNLAIPGWTTNTLGILLVCLFQILVFSILILLTSISQKGIKKLIPIENYKYTILNREIFKYEKR